MTTSCVPDITAWAAKWIDCCEEPHCRSMVTAGTRLRQLRGEHRVAADMEGLLARLADAAHDHIVDRGRIDPGAVDQGVQHLRGQIDRVPVLQRAAALAPGGAHRIDDIGLGHSRSPYVRVNPA